MEQPTLQEQAGKITGVFITEQALSDRVQTLGNMIAKDYANQDLVLICILKGSFIFVADVARAISRAQQQMGLPVSRLFVDFLTLQSYGDQTVTSGVVRITADLGRPIEGKHVLVVEDIVDTGLTMSYLMENLSTRNPASVKLCSLLHKPSRTIRPVKIDYLGFTIDDHFVVGYGLDYRQSYRNLPYLAVVEP